jgi:hypothetical protein
MHSFRLTGPFPQLRKQGVVFDPEYFGPEHRFPGSSFFRSLKGHHRNPEFVVIQVFNDGMHPVDSDAAKRCKPGGKQDDMFFIALQRL